MYRSMNEFMHFFPLLVFNIFSQIPDKVDRNPDWRDKLLYLGLSAFWSPRVYVGQSQSTHMQNFGAAAALELHLLKFLSAELGLEISTDWIGLSDTHSVIDGVLEIPISVKYIIKPGDYFRLEPYFGIHFNFPLFRLTNPPFASWMVGLQYGVRAGSGILFINPRFSMDFGRATIDDGFTTYDFQRYVIHIGAGYKFGLMKKK